MQPHVPEVTDNKDSDSVIEEPEDTPPPWHPYNLRSLSQHMVNAVIIKEMERTRDTTPVQVQSHRTYAQAVNGVGMQEAWRNLAFTPTQFMATAVIDPETGGKLEYCKLM